MEVSCGLCGSYSVTPTTTTPHDGLCEYRCDDCGEYFVDKAQPAEPEVAPDASRQVIRSG